jgi:DNA repair protein RadA/Sms
MAKIKKIYICKSCGSSFNKWQGQCDGCGEWNSLTEENDQTMPSGLGKAGKTTKGRVIPLSTLNALDIDLPRMVSGISEFDRALGGGLIAGSATLIGGDPGIGKSTLLLQAVSKFAQNGYSTIYISGEESPSQVRMRAKRLGLEKSPVRLGAETSLRDILTTITDQEKLPDVLVIDSIQTIYSDTIESAPGTVSQVRSCAQELVHFAKKKGVAVFIVGHVTKEGQIAGPRILEHMVDTVLYFEGDPNSELRLLRGFKNRFGSTNEVGIFEMSKNGLLDAETMAGKFFNKDKLASGSALTVIMEGSRPIIIEIQALVSEAYGHPKRSSTGFDNSRLNMLLALLEKKLDLPLGTYDVYVNISGGIKINEPSADLAIIAAILSSYRDRELSSETLFLGEVSLTGEIREIPALGQRLKEIETQGFKKAIVPTKPLEKSSIKCFVANEVSRVVEWM